MSFDLVETAEDYLVKTPSFNTQPISEEEAVANLPVDSPLLKALESPYVDASFGKTDGNIKVRQWSYSKEKYTKPQVQKLIDEKFYMCKRCTVNTVGEHRELIGDKMTLQNVAYDAVLGTVVGTAGIAAHFMLFQPNLDVYNIMGVKGATIVDVVVGILAIVASYKWLGKTTYKVMGIVIGSILLALGVAHQFALIPGTTLRFATPTPRVWTPPVAAPAPMTGVGAIGF